MFRRRPADSSVASSGDSPPPDSDPAAGVEAAEPTPGQHGHGPYDAADVDLELGHPRVDLGGLMVGGVEGIELRLQADQASGAVTSVLFVAADEAMELRVFAAPKSGGLWDELRSEIAAEATRLGGTVDEDVGPHGPQLRLQVPLSTGGRTGVQASRVVAVEGPRWLLRVTYLGAAAGAHDAESSLEHALRDVVVVRGSGPMSPREPLPLRLPPDARQAGVGGPAEPTISQPS